MNKLSYVVEVRGRKGKLLQRIAQPSHSYVRQWLQIWYANAQNAPLAGVIDTGGVARAPWGDSNNLRADAAAANVNMGIRVGGGVTAVAMTDIALEVPYGEGAGLNQFNHQAMAYVAPAVVGNTSSFTASRVMINNSGAVISVTEIGCYVQGSNWFFLGFRDVLPGSAEVPDGGSITIIYTVATVV